MRCISCHSFSLSVVCDKCRNNLLSTSVLKRRVGTLEVVSLFGYKSIEPYLVTKHTPVGYRVYKYFGKHFIAPFIYDFLKNIDEPITLVGIDERVNSGYSHTALLVHHSGHHPHVTVEHHAMKARKTVKYAGKTLQYRLEHPREFMYHGKSLSNIILVDDIVTTGTTLQEAHNILTDSGAQTLFAITLADAQY